ncbi:bacteriohopanetetrol glucosamine biosynthesis glycosyltransferase HpnI (plasmid) [Mycetohabitans endofungorum]|uniref:bacteriohopanetetrol glucosamine biosynthesis glycosyltransferase HpnI n=1 Tax=Mycetohabitans endofungorum TaxID=417203 RepID=UPI0030CF4563
MAVIANLASWLIVTVAAMAVLYAVIAAAASLRGRRPSHQARLNVLGAPLASVSVLKPLCGLEPRLFENLATFCEQDHPCFELLCGVHSSNDPAIAVVERLQAAYPACDIRLCVDPHVHGSNLKVSNLINLAAHARYDTIVLADSDIAVEPHYLASVCAPLADPAVGVVTCLYRAHGVGPWWTRLGAMFVNDWFAPSVRVAHAGGSTRFGFGSTLALRRQTLDTIGGFQRLKNCLADDYWLAEHARETGLATVLSDITVSTDVAESHFGALWRRETRWLRTIRSINPFGFGFLFVTFTSPWLIAAAALALVRPASQTLLGGVAAALASIGLLARLVLHWRGVYITGEVAREHDARTVRPFLRDLPLVPLRDMLLLGQWLSAAVGSHVYWRGSRVPLVGTPLPSRNRESL